MVKSEFFELSYGRETDLEKSLSVRVFALLKPSMSKKVLSGKHSFSIITRTSGVCMVKNKFDNTVLVETLFIKSGISTFKLSFSILLR